MNAEYVQSENSFEIVPAESISAGEVIIQKDLIGITTHDIAAGALGVLHRKGAFDIVKKADDDFAVGDKVYWDAVNKQATLTAAGNKLLGLALAATTEGDERVRTVVNVFCETTVNSASAIADIAATASDLDDQSGGTASATHQLAAVGDTTTDQSASINANFATVGAEYNTLKDDVEAGTAKINAVLAALRTLGLVAAE